MENPKVTAKRRYTEHELRKLLKGYSKSKYDTEWLMEKMDVAMKNVEAFCSDIWRLQEEVGSNLGDLIKSMKAQ